MNLLEETIKVLQNHNKKLSDIVFVRQKEDYWDQQKEVNLYVNEEYLSKILNVEYDNGYGGVEINRNLELVGKDFWLERHEYDGSEWWEYKEMPQYNKEAEGDHIRIKEKRL